MLNKLGIILSSTEGLDIARFIQSELSRIGINALLWDQAGRKGMLLPSLIEEMKNTYQFAVFLLTPDDDVRSRSKNHKAPRDNVILELGLWLGKVGMDRTFIIRPKGEDLKIPSDLSGLLFDPYDPAIPPGVALGPICLSIKKRLDELGDSGSKEGQFEVLPYDMNDSTKRLLASKERIKSAVKGEKIKFIAITGKGIICPDLRPGQPNTFLDAVKRGVVFNGIVLDPESEQARTRSEVETPTLPMPERLLYKDAEIVRKWLLGSCKQDGVTAEEMKRFEIKYCGLSISFSLWLFKDFALIEPYHYGKFPEAHHLCGFSLMKIGNNTYEYEVLKKHFQLLWSRSRDICR